MHFSTSFASALAIISAVSAAPASLTARRTCTKGATVDANYDDQNYFLGAVLPATTAVGVYKGLAYNAFVGLQYLSDGIQTGIIPHSSPNEIVTGLVQSLTNGTAYVQATGATTYFDFHSFYFGCALDSAAGAIGVPAACTVTIKGYYEGKELAVQEFKFEPSGLLSSTQDKAYQAAAKCHTSFTGVDKVEFTTDDPTLQVLLLDNLNYTPSTCN